MSDMNRRGWGVGIGLGLVALGGGAWLRSRKMPMDTDLAAAPAAASAPPGASGPPVVAQANTPPVPLPQAIVTLDGRTLGAADIAGRAVVLNFWAPWCPPCVREMPDIDRFARSAAGKDTLVIGLAVDEQPAVEKFIAAHPVSFPIAVLGYAGLAWVRRLSNDSNVALPFSAVFDRSQRLVQRKFGPTSSAELSEWSRHF